MEKSDWDTGWRSERFLVDGSYQKEYPWIIVTVWVKTENSSGNNRPVLLWYNDKERISNAETEFLPHGTADWTKLTLSALPPRGATAAQVSLRSDANTGSIWYDDLTFEQTVLPITTPLDTEEDASTAPYHSFLKDYGEDALAESAQDQILRYYELNGKGEKRVGELEQVYKKATGKKRQKFRLHFAKALMDQNRSEEAIQHLQTLAADKTDPEIAVQTLLALGSAYQKHQELPKAIAAYEKLAATYSTATLEANYRMGMAYLETMPDGSYPKAHEILLKTRPLAANDPRGADMLRRIDFALAETDYFMEHYQEALKEFDQVIANEPASTIKERAVLLRSGALRELNRLEEALAGYVSLEKAQERDVAANALYWRADLLAALGRRDESLVLWRRLQKEYADQGYEFSAQMAINDLTEDHSRKTRKKGQR